MPEVSNHLFTIYHLQYKKKLEMIEFTYNSSLSRLFLKLISLLNDLSDFVVKFVIHHLHYKEKPLSNPNRTFGYTRNSLHLLCNLSNLSATSQLAGNSSICVAEPDLVIKKEELLKTPSIYAKDI